MLAGQSRHSVEITFARWRFEITVNFSLLFCKSLSKNFLLIFPGVFTPSCKVWSCWVAWFKSLFDMHRQTDINTYAHTHTHTDNLSIMYKIVLSQRCSDCRGSSRTAVGRRRSDDDSATSIDSTEHYTGAS